MPAGLFDAAATPPAKGSALIYKACSGAAFRRWLRVALAVLSLALPALATTAPPPGESPWLRLQRAHWVRQGAEHPEHLIYVITDANCPYCHDLWLSLQPHYRRGLEVRYLLVGIIASDSPGKAAAILESRDPSRALDQNERQWARLPGDLGGGIPPLKSPRPETLAALRANEQLMRDLGAPGTPALVYRSADHVVHLAESIADPAKLASILSSAAPD